MTISQEVATQYQANATTQLLVTLQRNTSDSTVVKAKLHNHTIEAGVETGGCEFSLRDVEKAEQLNADTVEGCRVTHSHW